MIGFTATTATLTRTHLVTVKTCPAVKPASAATMAAARKPVKAPFAVRFVAAAMIITGRLTFS